ncbi:hypothetical protein L207DRAFT_271554 [Hyaloscypha variabilis F]|uniref:Uncharacterized protein n=1 Tax=Hyaloscypha variabilis (strain UAMH 11265 / GT02V1 / F) TaxID=1149755 RepID=A0A2J6S001_HYAVF|nr:hypothetical protein L207DRAFT_271554 [Hyaloscypha variabilis F]
MSLFSSSTHLAGLVLSRGRVAAHCRRRGGSLLATPFRRAAACRASAACLTATHISSATGRKRGLPMDKGSRRQYHSGANDAALS